MGNEFEAEFGQGQDFCPHLPPHPFFDLSAQESSSLQQDFSSEELEFFLSQQDFSVLTDFDPQAIDCDGVATIPSKINTVNLKTLMIIPN